MPGLGNGLPRVVLMPSGLADRIANQVASQEARYATVSIAVRFRNREFKSDEQYIQHGSTALNSTKTTEQPRETSATQIKDKACTTGVMESGTRHIRHRSDTRTKQRTTARDSSRAKLASKMSTCCLLAVPMSMSTAGDS